MIMYRKAVGEDLPPTSKLTSIPSAGVVKPSAWPTARNARWMFNIPVGGDSMAHLYSMRELTSNPSSAPLRQRQLRASTASRSAG